MLHLSHKRRRVSSLFVEVDHRRFVLGSERMRVSLRERNLTYLYLYQNKLFGVIPNSVQALNLARVDLNMNNLTVLLFYFNPLSGDEILNGLGLLPKLSNFSVYENKFNGTLPVEFSRYLRLVGFEVKNNQLSGGLPDHLCDSGVLRVVVTPLTLAINTSPSPSHRNFSIIASTTAAPPLLSRH
ncbi:hypothetical protein PIB30_038313 [Stylosanthes scabra]|uniref:Uncharacterized protein n=1 Tax=Stylosanthes scabra TaxID=79078 RepID=A0ABU6TDP2_9FABA|nr:hypothetical protein [Stylosanthes scabra]